MFRVIGIDCALSDASNSLLSNEHLVSLQD
jgi:hypothetical protein